MKSLVLAGKKFVKASEAALEHGYTNDYIGQLCRANKVEAQLVGRAWYVSEESLQKHRKDRYRSSQKKTKEQIKKMLNNQTNTSFQAVLPKYYNRLVSNTKIEYASDNEADLMPVPKKLKVNSESENETIDSERELGVSEIVEAEAEYYLDTIYDDVPKSGVLTIVEDETDAPMIVNESTPNSVSVGLLEEKPKITKKEKNVKVHTEAKNYRPSSFSVKSTKIQTKEPKQSFSVVAPLSVSLLAGLAIAMLVVSLSWQFQTDDTGFSERYKLNMSSLMHQ